VIFIVLLFSFISSLLLFVGLFKITFISKKKINLRLNHYLNIGIQEKMINQKEFNFALKLRLANEQLKKKLKRKKINEKLELQLKRSGLPIKQEEFIGFHIMSVILVGMVMYLIFVNYFFLLIGNFIGYIMPIWWLKKKQKERLVKFNDGLPDMITTIVGSLRAGFSFQQALKSVVEESNSPIKDEMEVVIKELQYGGSTEEVLYKLKERMPSEDLDLMVQAILIQRQVGGNLATVLDKIVETIRDRTRIQQQIVTLTAQGRLSGIVIACLPVALGFMLYLIEPEYIGSLFNHPVGLVMVGLGAVSGIIGFVFIRKITTIEV
jgi:tight adherence protein B